MPSYTSDPSRDVDLSSIHISDEDKSAAASAVTSVSLNFMDRRRHQPRVDNRECEDEVVEGVMRQLFKKQMSPRSNKSNKSNTAAIIQRGHEEALANAVSAHEEEEDAISCGSDISLPPPPPPPMVYRPEPNYNKNEAASSPHGTDSTSRSFDEERYLDTIAAHSTGTGGRNKNKNAEHDRGAYVVEKTDSIETMDLTQWPAHWNKFNLCGGDDKKWYMPGQRRRLLLLGLVVAVLGLCFIIGLSVGVSNNNKEKKQSSSQALSSSSNLRANTPVPTPVTPEQEDATDTDAATDEEEDASGAAEQPDEILPAEEAEVVVEDESGTLAPTECQDRIEVDRFCYNVDELDDAVLFGIDFQRCEPHKENWIGIFQEGLDDQSLPDPLLWLWTCNSQDLKDCNKEGVIADSLGMAGRLEPGFYQAHFIERNGKGPFQSYLSSSVFEVSDNCDL